MYMTFAQMEFLGYRQVKTDAIDLENPEVQKQLLKGNTVFVCNTCGDMTWVKIGKRELDLSKANVHFHYISSLGDQQLERQD